MDRLVFGVAGVPSDSEKPTSEAGIERVRALGLGSMEMAWVHGVKLGEEAALGIRATAEENGIRLSAHGAYYINLNADDPAIRARSKERILKGARMGNLCGISSLVFHAASYMRRDPEEVYGLVKEALEEISETLGLEGNSVILRPEITGKPSYFGNLDELLRLSSEVDRVAPCIDFAHLHARSGGASNSLADFASVLEQIGTELGPKALENMHIHVAGIQYTDKGEQKHRMLDDSDLKYRELLAALADYGAKGLVICESPDPVPDALLLQREYAAG
ncbi:MAG: TIM barrel protein [Candidatus Latescibacterota bacterium]